MIRDISNFLCVFLNDRDNANLGFNEATNKDVIMFFQ